MPPYESAFLMMCAMAVAHLVATTSKARVAGSKSRVTAAQLGQIRRQVALAIGVEG